MRLPFMQLESDVIAHGAAEVSNLAGCSIPQALGHIAFVRAWAVSQATDEAPPDGWVGGDSATRRIEAAAHWSGEKGALVQALLDAGHVRTEEGGMRVLHLEPYVQAWNKNRTAKERMRTIRERSTNKSVSDANEVERSAKFGQQTQTQTQNASASQATGVAAPPGVLDDPHDGLPDATDDAQSVAEERPPLVLDIQQASKKPRKPSAAEALFARLEARRKEKCEEHGVPFVETQSGWPPARINRDLGPIARAEAAKGPEWERFCAAWWEFLDDPAARQADVPLSLDWFWKARDRYYGRALKAAGGGE